ncbi:MAG: RnfABCDGE type electron transport complex subunit B [Candidatus Omnitrophota bacterium]
MDNLMLASVSSMAGLAVLFAGVLAFADKKLRVEEDPKITEINKLLPHVNCGACGYLSCHDFAEHIVTEGADPAACRVLGEEAREGLFALLGKDGGEHYPLIPLIQCAAKSANKVPSAEYKGVNTCLAADLVFGAGMECEYGCVGLGDCAAVCPFDALHMKDGLPEVDQDKCTGCGKCSTVCPRNIISMAEKKHDKLFYVACMSHDSPLRVRKICGVGCIGCGICVKMSPEGFFSLTDGLSRAEYEKQDKQEAVRAVAGKCPTKVIKEL